MSVHTGDIVRILGENGISHFLLADVVCWVVDADPGPQDGDDTVVLLSPLDPGPHNWLDADDVGTNYVSREDFTVIASSSTPWHLAEVEAFLSDTTIATPTPNGGSSTS